MPETSNFPTTLDPEHRTTTALCGPFVEEGECVICGRIAPICELPGCGLCALVADAFADFASIGGLG